MQKAALFFILSLSFFIAAHAQLPDEAPVVYGKKVKSITEKETIYFDAASHGDAVVKQVYGYDTARHIISKIHYSSYPVQSFSEIRNYTANGKLEQVLSNYNGKIETETFVYNSEGKIASVLNSREESKTVYDYNASGNIYKFDTYDLKGKYINTYSFFYNSNNQLSGQIITPGDDKIYLFSYQYTDFDSIAAVYSLSKLKAKPHTIDTLSTEAYSYDSQNRLVQKRFLGTQRAFAYDYIYNSDGTYSSVFVEGAHSTISYYNARRQLVSTTERNGLAGYSAKYYYTADGLLQRVEYLNESNTITRVNEYEYEYY